MCTAALATISRTNKSLHQIVIPFLYRDVWLYIDSRTAPVLDLLDRFTADPQLASYVQSIWVRELDESEDTETVLLRRGREDFTAARPDVMSHPSHPFSFSHGSCIVSTL